MQNAVHGNPPLEPVGGFLCKNSLFFSCVYLNYSFISKPWNTNKKSAMVMPHFYAKAAMFTGKRKRACGEKYKGNICSFYPITDYKDWFLKYKARFLIEASLFLCLTRNSKHDQKLFFDFSWHGQTNRTKRGKTKSAYLERGTLFL